MENPPQEKTNQNKQDAASPPPDNPYSFIWQFLSLRTAGWIVAGIIFILLLIVFFKPSISEKAAERIGITDTSKEDPLRIDGTWTYVTDLRTDKNPNGHNDFVAYKGENTIKIGSNKNGYVMTGERTHAKKLGEANFIEVDKQPIEIKNVSVDVDSSELFFTFIVSQGKGRGYATLTANTNRTELNGTVYYLFPNNQWDVVKISFTNRK